ncbi:MAG: hypothetical protein WCJ64_20495 [Rhodospirillaceae bacterium]
MSVDHYAKGSGLAESASPPHRAVVSTIRHQPVVSTVHHQPVVSTLRHQPVTARPLPPALPPTLPADIW